MVRMGRLAGHALTRSRAFAPATVPQREPLLPPHAVDPLVIDALPGAAQCGPRTSVSIALLASGQLAQALRQRRIVPRVRTVAGRRATDPDQATRLSLRKALLP